MKASKITLAAVIAALYTSLTLILAPISFGYIQLRASEALCILPLLFPESIAGLFIGCILANTFGVFLGLSTVWDIIFGSLATLAAAYLTSKAKNKWIAALPPVICNGLIVGPMIAIMFTAREAWSLQIPLTIATVATGEAIVMYFLGIPLYMLMQRLKPRIDKFRMR